jgi:hypothetical protein
MALTAQNILDRASMIIQDLTNVRWPASELLNWLNDSRRELAVLRPDIYSQSTTLSLSAGAKQELPAGGLRLMDVPRNTSGAAVTLTHRGFLDQQNPTWQTMTQTATIKHFMVDERDPSTFWVYPPATSAASVEIIYQSTPTDYAVGDSLSSYEELYGGAFVDYVCYRAFSKDSEYAGNAQRALAHYQQYSNALGLGRQTDFGYSANQNNIGGARNNPKGGGIGAMPASPQS